MQILSTHMFTVLILPSKFLCRVSMTNAAIEKSSQISRHDLAMVWFPLIIDRLQEQVNLNMPARQLKHQSSSGSLLQSVMSFYGRYSGGIIESPKVRH